MRALTRLLIAVVILVFGFKLSRAHDLEQPRMETPVIIEVGGNGLIPFSYVLRLLLPHTTAHRVAYTGSCGGFVKDADNEPFCCSLDQRPFCSNDGSCSCGWDRYCASICEQQGNCSVVPMASACPDD